MAVAYTTDELSCTRERDNFIRLSVLLIDGGTKVLRELFDSIHPPSSLSYVLRTREADIKKNTKLTRPQREVLYGLTSGDYGKSQDFDITLLFQLLRCKPLCNLTPPSTGWDDLPSLEDTSPAADMARLKYYRNKVCHSPNLKVQEEQFSIIWKEIQDVLLRLAELVNPARGVELSKIISEYGSAALTHADNDNVRELDQWYQNDLDVKDEMVKLKATVIQEISDMKTMLQGMQRLNPNQSQGPNTQATLHIHVNLDSYQPRGGRRVASRCHPSGHKQHADQIQLPREPQPSQEACASETDHPNPLAESQEVPNQSHNASASQSSSSVNTTDHPQMPPEGGSSQQDKEESLFPAIADLLFKAMRPLTNERFKEYLNYLVEVRHLIYISQQTGSLIITVACPSLEILQGLWDDYKSAHLKEVTERCLVTGDILGEFDLVEVNLEVTIPEEEYFSCRRMLIEQEIGVSDLAAIRNIERAIDEGPLSSAQTIISNIKKATVSAQTSEATNTAKKVYPSGMGVDDSYPLKCESISLPVQETADLDQSRAGDSEEYEILTHEDGDQENTFKQQLPKPPVPATDDSGRLQSLQASAKTFMENQDAQMHDTREVFVRSSSSPEASGPQPQLRYVIFHVYMPENDNAIGMDVIIYDHINRKDIIIEMNRKGNGIWESPPHGISLDCDFAYSYRAWFKDLLLPAYGYREPSNRPITEAVHHYNVFRSWMSERDYQTRLFWGQYRFVQGFYKSICSNTKSLYDCLVLTQPMKFGKKISKSNLSNIVSWIGRELEEGSSNAARTFLLILLGKFVFYYPKHVQLDVKRGVIDAAFMALTTLNSDEIPRCSKAYLKAVAPLLINGSSYQSRLALLTFLCTMLDRGDLLEVVDKVNQAYTDEEQFDNLLDVVSSQLVRLSEVMKREIATRFALEAPCLKSLLKCGKALYSVYHSSSDMANTFANIFESKCERITEPATVYSDSLLQVRSDIPDGLQDLIEASFVKLITRCMKHDSAWDKTKLEFVRQLLLGEVLKKPEHIWAVIEEMSVSKCEGLLNLVVEALDADKFCSTWKEVDSGQKETLCFSCCESIRCMYDKQAGTHTVNNTLFALKQVCKTRNVRDDEELKESFKDRVMNCLQERLKPCPLSSFLEAFELAGNVSNAPKKWYIQGLAKAFWKSPGDSHKKLEQILVTIRKADPSETEGCLHLTRYWSKYVAESSQRISTSKTMNYKTLGLGGICEHRISSVRWCEKFNEPPYICFHCILSFAEKIVVAVLEVTELPVAVNDFAPETDEAIIAATVANAETWISLLSANGSVNAMRNHSKILRTEKSIKWLAESIRSSRNIRVEFIHSLEQTTSVELLGRFCAAVFSPETKEEEEASLKIQIAHLFSKCKEHFFMLLKMNDLLDFCRDVSSDVLELGDEKYLFTEMADRISNRSELFVERIVKCDYYWAPFQQLLAPAEALSELKTSHVFRNIAIHCLHQDVKMKSNISSDVQRPLSSAFATNEVEASDITAASGVQGTVEDVAVFLKTKAIVSFQEACNPLYDDFLQMSLVEASIAWKGIDQSDVSKEVELVESYFTRGHISESVKLSIRQMLQLPSLKDKARALLKAFNSFGMAQTDESGLIKKFRNIIDLTDNEEVKLLAIFEAIDEDVQKACRFLDCKEFLEVIVELGKSKEFIAFITEKADENMADLTDAVGDYSEQFVTEQTVSDLIKVHAFLRNVVTVQEKGAMVLLSTAYRCMPRDVDIAAKLQSCRSKTQSLKSLYAANRSEKTKVIIRKFLSEGYYKLKLTSDGQWSVAMSYDGSEETGGDHTMAYLQDLCSRAHLLVRARKKGEAESPQIDGKSSLVRFSEFIEEVNLISELINVSSQLQRSGHPTFREFEAELQAANTEVIKRKVEEVKGELTTWKEVLHSARSKYTFLNFFYSDQLRMLEEFFTQGHREDATSSVKTAIFDLMRYVDPSITCDELHQFLTHYHHPILSSGPKRLEDNLYAMGSALDEIFEARSMFKTKPEQKEVLATQVQEFCVVRLEPESSETVNAMMSLYAHTPEVFPSPNQVMFCHKETSTDELSLFIRRCFGDALSGKPEALYYMANVEVLNGDIQLELVRLLKEFQGQTNTPYNLCLIIRADRHHLLVQQFLKFDLGRVPWLTNSELEQTFHSYFPDVVFVTSDLPGLGKTEWIREDAANKGRGVTIVPLSGKVSRDRLVQRLSALKQNGDYYCLHFDLSDIEDPLALDTLLFEFIALGLLSHGTKLVHRPSRHIYIEVANTINHWLQDSLIVCKCFRRAHQDSENPYDKLIVSSDIRSPLQVVCHYFDALETGTLQDTDVCFDGPHKVESLSQERCTDLLSKFYPENRDFTYTRFNTFLRVFAEQLLRLSASQFLRNDWLQEMTKDPYGIRKEVVWSLFNISQKLVDYRQTAQPNVEEARKPLTHAPTAEAMVARVQGMSSWSSDHLVYIFYGQSMKPLYRKTTLVPMNIKDLIVRQSSTSEMPDYENMTQDELREFLEEISNQQSTCGNDLLKSYVLTVDNILKMVFILLRLRAKLPVVLMGETGCGKTSLVKFLAQSYKVPFDTFSLHAGTTEEEVLSFIKKMERKAEEAKASGKPAWVFLDEINTCDHLGLISEITCHRRVQGRPLPSNLVFIAACNPYCIRPAEARQTEGLLVKESLDELSRLVYRVHSLPEVLLDYVWDFGSLDGKDELSYIQRMTEGLFQDHKDGIFANLLYRSQLFVREAEKTKYCVSLRDIDRCRKMLVWFRDSVQSRPRLPPAQIEEHVREAYEDVARMDKAEVAVVLALALCYQSRFPDADLRKSYQREMEDIMASDDHTNLKRGDFAKIVRIEEEEYLARMELPPGTAKNAALRENVFVLLSSICNRIPVFVVGKPGCSKSLSMQVIRSNLRGADSSDEFLKTLPQVYVVSFQGSKSSTSEGISKVFEKAHKYKEYNRDSSVLPVVLLDEVGLAEQSSHNPLKVLHSLLEPSTGRHPEVAVVGLSNWALDPAKMNRGIYLSRPDPTIEDICETGKSLRHVSRGEHARIPSDQELMELAKAYHRYQQTQTYPNFHGLRDYYSFVRCLSQSLTDAVFSSSGCQCIREALQRNFGGVSQNPAIQSSFMEELPKCSLPVSNVLPVKELICRNVQDRSARHLMLLTAGDSVIQILQQVLQETKKETITILGSHFVNDLADYDFQVLSEIILHMERDCVLILRDLECIYGSLYDMLNQNYTTVGEHRYCRVALGPYSVPMCQVHDGFRCIVMKDRAEVDYTDAPFLNRFEKQSLLFEDALSATQMAACKELTSWTTEISTMSDSSLLFDERDMFLDFHRETIPSLILYHGQDERLSSEELIQECKNDLMLTATPDGILRTVKSKWAETRPTEVETMYEDHLRKHNHQGFKAFIQESLATCTPEERKAGLRLVVMTHSSAYQTVPDLLEGVVTCQTATLSHFETQRQFSSFVKSFWINLETSMLILQCRPEVDCCHMSLVQNIIEQHHFEFQKRSHEAFHFSQVEKHVCLILHIRKELLGSEAQSGFKGWKQVTVDSLANPELPLRSLLGASICQIIESHDRLATEIIRDELLSCFTQIQNLSLKRYTKIVQAVRGSKAITEALKDHVIKCLRKSSSEDKENAPWLLSVATNQEVLINSSTFQDAVYSYITDLVKTSLAMLVYQLESKSAWNAIVCNQPSNEKIPVWIKLLGSGTIVNLEYVSYPRGSEYYVLETPVLELVYPFSFVFATRVQEIESQFLANVKTLEEDKERLNQSQQLEAKEMFALVERFSSLIEPKLREIFEDTWLQENVMSYIEDLMDLKTVEHSKTLSRYRRVAVMKAIIASHIRHISTSHDLVLFVTHVHVWFWLNSSLITSILQVVKVYQDLDPSDPRLDQLLQEYSSAFPTTLSQGAEGHDTEAEIAQDSSDTESTSSYTDYEGMQHFEGILVNEVCQMKIQMTTKLVSSEDWQRNAALVLSAVRQIFEFGDLPISFHVLRVCNDFMRLLVLPGLASVESAGEVAIMSFLECPDDFEAVLRIAENCGPGTKPQQFIALFFRRCIESWPTDYAESHKEMLSLMIKIILSAGNDVRLAYFGPVVKLLLSDVPPFVFYQLLHTSDPVRESGFLSLLNDALLKLEVEVGIDAHSAVLICDSIEDYSFRRISSMEATSGTQTYSDLENSDPNPSSAINVMSDFTAAVKVFREGSDETRGLRKICAVAFIRSLLRFVAKYCVTMFYESGEFLACSEDMAELFRDLNVFLETSSSGRSTKDERSTPCLFFLRELRQKLSMYEVKQLVQSTVVCAILPLLRELRWSSGRPLKIGHGLLNSLKRCSTTSDAVNALTLEKQAGKLRKLLPQILEDHTERIYLFSAVSSIYLEQCHGMTMDSKRGNTERLAKELKDLNEVYVQLTRRLVGVVSFCTTELQLNSESSSIEVQRAFLLTHIAACISPVIQDAPINDCFLVALMVDPKLCQESYLPGLPDICHISATESRSETRCYACQCGVAFITAVSQQTCSKCSTQFEPLPVLCRNRKKGASVQAKGYTKVKPEELRDVWQSVRNLSPPVFRILHLLVHACLYLGYALGIVKGQTLSEFIGVEDEVPSAYCFKHICNDLRVLENLLNLRQEDAVNLIHLVLNSSGKLLAHDKSDKLCKEHDGRESWEARFADSMEPLLSDKDKRCVRLLPVEIAASKSTCVAASLEEEIEEQDCLPDGIAQRNAIMPRLFRSTRKRSTADLKAAFLNDPDEVEKHPFLRLVFQYEDVLPLLHHLIPLLKWTREVESHLSHGISREEARSREISTVVFQLKSEKSDLQKSSDDFQEAWRMVLPLLKEEIEENVPFISDDFPISWCLLDQKGNGRFLCSVLKILASYQNEFLVQALVLANEGGCHTSNFLGNPQSPNVMPLVLLQECGCSDVICFEWPESDQTHEEDDGFLSYSQHNTEYGRGWDVHYNFGMIETALARTLLWRKAFLSTKDGLREFAYSNELFHSGANIFKEIENVITQEPLTRDLHSGLQHLKTVERAKVRDLLNRLEVVLCFLKQTQGNPEQPLVEYTEKWISMLTSFPKANLPQPHDRIQLKHVVALYEGLEDILAAKALSGLADNFRARLPDSKSTEARFSKERKPFSLQAVLTALYRFMYRYLATPRSLAICKEPLLTYLNDRTLWPMEKISTVSLEEPEIMRLMQELFPMELKVKHIHKLATLLQRKLRPAQLAKVPGRGRKKLADV